MTASSLPASSAAASSSAANMSSPWDVTEYPSIAGIGVECEHSFQLQTGLDAACAVFTGALSLQGWHVVTSPVSS